MVNMIIDKCKKNHTYPRLSAQEVVDSSPNNGHIFFDLTCLKAAVLKLILTRVAF